MKMLLIIDGDATSALSEDVRTRLAEMATAQGFAVETIELHGSDSPPCTGCLHCLTVHPGTCSSRSFAGITQRAADCPVIVYLTPVVFGTFSSTIKNVLDRGGIVIRNHAACRQIIIGYGEDATEEERSTFIDITARHRGRADIVHPNHEDSFEAFLTRCPKDTRGICQGLDDIAGGRV